MLVLLHVLGDQLCEQSSERSMSECSFQDAVESIRTQLHIEHHFKEQQLTGLQGLCDRKNVFAILPTGFGKSTLYALPPLILDKMYPDAVPHIALVVSPLRALMRDQVSHWSLLGIQTCGLMQADEMDQETIEGIENNKYSLIFTSPEALQQQRWRKVFKSHASNICLLALDEVHCVVEWGTSFRPEYAKVGSMRSILSHAPILATTATATMEMKNNIMSTLSMATDDFIHIAVVPDRPNIFLDIKGQKRASIEEDLSWYCNILREKGCESPKCIIFCRSLKAMTDIYEYFENSLGSKALFCETGLPGDCLVEMFYGDLDKTTQELLPAAFKKQDSKCRCMVATIAFGMGVQIDDVDFVLHWGPPRSLLAYWQEVGRAGRDGRKCKAIMFCPPNSLHPRHVEKTMLDSVKSGTCMRNNVLHELKVDGVTSADIAACCGSSTCCTYCAAL